MDPQEGVLGPDFPNNDSLDATMRSISWAGTPAGARLGTGTTVASDFFANNPPPSATVLTAIQQQHRVPMRRSAMILNAEGIKFRGGNIVPKATDGGLWTNLYNNWDWAGWIKPQVDNIAAIGANAIRLVGGPDGVLNGTYTQATYLAHWKQLLDYCASKNLYVYAAGGDNPQMTNGKTILDAQPILVAHASLLELYANAIAFDVWQESNGLVTAADGTTVTNAIRAVSTLPLTFSHTNVTAALMADATFLASSGAYGFGGIVDFFDVHVYFNAALADLNALWALTSLPLMIGEFGAAQNNTQAQQTVIYQRVRDFMATRPDVMGAFVWAITDQDTVNTNQWGVFDSSFVYRAWIGDVFKTFPRYQGPWHLSLPPADEWHNFTLTINDLTTWHSVASGGTDGSFPFTLQLNVPVRVVARLTADMTGATGDVFVARLQVDGGYMGQRTGSTYNDPRDVNLGNIRATGGQVYSFYLLPGSHTIDFQVGIMAGSTTGCQLEGTNSRLVLDFYPV